MVEVRTQSLLYCRKADCQLPTLGCMLDVHTMPLLRPPAAYMTSASVTGVVCADIGLRLELPAKLLHMCAVPGSELGFPIT